MRRSLAVAGALVLLLLPAVAFGAPSEFEELRSKGWLWAYLGVFAAGVLTSLTPCVYPMIGITVGVFGARDAGSRLRAFGLASMYVLGMVVMFSALGIVFSLSGHLSGSGFLLSRPEVVIPIVILYVALAASMFGLYEIRLPAGLQARLSGVGGRGTLGAFLMGLVGGFVAAPCTGPILAGILAFIATTKSMAIGVSLMTTYALGMGVLFLVIATFALTLPKGGPWMILVEIIAGITLLVVAFYFLRPIWPALARLSSPSFAFLAGGVAAAAAGLALLIVYMRRMASPLAGWLKVGGIVLATAGASAAVNWTLTPRTALPWRLDREAALNDAKSSGKPALLDFSAEWCKPCKVFETDLFTDPAVHAEIADRFVAVKFDVTADDERDQAAKDAWNAPNLPTVILLGSDGIERRRFKEIPSRDEFLAAVRAVR
ncbi:MAG TPA: cytochrome c biogenesis protein CcdA [Haliangiales bacterium]|nr:cytochrome c biogenesis protein CcdA [Haliangiales bacterium]